MLWIFLSNSAEAEQINVQCLIARLYFFLKITISQSTKRYQIHVSSQMNFKTTALCIHGTPIII